MSKVLVIGGGVVGLTTAWELAQRGLSVSVVDQGLVGREASWAGAGMLPPAQLCESPGVRELALRSTQLWPRISEVLHEQTGLDNGYRACGAIQIAIDSGADLADQIEGYQQQGVPVERLDAAGLKQIEPGLSDDLQQGYFLPTMAQVRNPWHLRALRLACENLGVTIHENTPIVNLEGTGKVTIAKSEQDQFSADTFIVTAGAWSSHLVGSDVEVAPVRGQIVLLKSMQPRFHRIIEDGKRYLVPREDGHILIGSTEEHVGFEKANTEEGVQGLLDFAVAAMPELADLPAVQSWSGLRPFGERGRPTIGFSQQWENVIVAAGHFRDGLSQSPATAMLVADLVTGSPVDEIFEDLKIC